jgi:hypothetical protein
MGKTKVSLHQQATELIQQLSPEKLRIAVGYLIYLQDRDSWEATYELASNPETTESLKRAEADTAAGRLRNWQDVRRDV